MGIQRGQGEGNFPLLPIPGFGKKQKKQKKNKY